MTVTCLIVDDSTRFLAATSLLKQNGIEVVGTASSAAEALPRADPTDQTARTPVLARRILAVKLTLTPGRPPPVVLRSLGRP